MNSLTEKLAQLIIVLTIVIGGYAALESRQYETMGDFKSQIETLSGKVAALEALQASNSGISVK